jgi:hypothetical protein
MRCASLFKQVKRTGLAFEAIVCLFIARCCLVFLPVRLMVGSSSGGTEDHVAVEDGDKIASIRWVSCWVAHWAYYVPWRAQCFEQAIASKLMLHRRGYASTICLGVKKDGVQILAHAWLKGMDARGWESF